MDAFQDATRVSSPSSTPAIRNKVFEAPVPCYVRALDAKHLSALHGKRLSGHATSMALDPADIPRNGTTRRQRFAVYGANVLAVLFAIAASLR